MGAFRGGVPKFWCAQRSLKHIP